MSTKDSGATEQAARDEPASEVEWLSFVNSNFSAQPTIFLLARWR